MRPTLVLYQVKKNKTPCKNKPCRASIIKVYCFFNSFITFSKYL